MGILWNVSEQISWADFGHVWTQEDRAGLGPWEVLIQRALAARLTSKVLGLRRGWHRRSLPIKPNCENSRIIQSSEGCWRAKFFIVLK